MKTGKYWAHVPDLTSISKRERINKVKDSCTLSCIHRSSDSVPHTYRVCVGGTWLTASYPNPPLVHICSRNEAQESSCDCGFWGVSVSRWGPGRWAASSPVSPAPWSRRGRWAWRRGSREGAGSLPSTWLSSPRRRGHKVQKREWALRRPCRLQARSPATGVRRAPRSCTGDILGEPRNRRPPSNPPLPRIAGPSRGVRERGRKWGTPKAAALRGWHQERNVKTWD